MGVKKTMVTVVVVVVMAFAGYMVMGIILKMKDRYKTKGGSDLPELRLKTLDGRAFTNSDLKEGKPVMIMHFHAGCDDCYAETKQLVTYIDLFDDEQILMVTREGTDELERFIQEFDLKNRKPITILTYQDDDFYEMFGVDVNPSYFVYDKNHKMVEFFKGALKMSLAKKLLNQ